MITYRIEPAGRLVIIPGTGALTAREALETQNRIRVDPVFDPAFALLTDYLAVTTLDFSR
jgi:hypothetical protein